MKPRTRKIILAVAAAATGAIADIGGQLQSGALSHPTRAVIVGIACGVVVRIAGAILANIPMPVDEPASAP